MHLPRNSFTVEAVSQDEELAESQVGKEMEHEERFSDWSPDHEVLVDISDRLLHIDALLVVANGHSPPRIDPHPRPVTAMQRTKARMARRHHEGLVARLTPRE